MTQDIIDTLAGLPQGSPLAAIRDRKPITRDHAQASYRALCVGRAHSYQIGHGRFGTVDRQTHRNHSRRKCYHQQNERHQRKSEQGFHLSMIIWLRFL